MSKPASEVYEIVLEETEQPRRFLRSAAVLFHNLMNLLHMGDPILNPGGQIISVVDKETGEEVFRHIEDMGDDEGHLLHGVQSDLSTMNANDFAARWATRHHQL